VRGATSLYALLTVKRRTADSW